MARDPSTPPWWQIFLGVEAVLLLIALLMPITPSKTGSDWSLAELFVESPSYPLEVGVYLVFVNLVLLMLAAVFFLTRGFRGRSEPEDEPR